MFFIRLLLLIALACSVSLAADRPNIVLIFTDDQGYNDVGCYGSEIPTPNIDRLAAEGMKFNHWYSASSICTPSRFGLLTGMNPSRSSDQLLSALMFLDPAHKTIGIKPGETTIAEILRGSDYDTTLIGKWHLGHGSEDRLPMSFGFNNFIGHTGGCIDYFTMTYGEIPDWYHQEKLVSENGYATDLITDESLDYLKSRKGKDEPFFLYIAYNAPHFAKGWSPSTQTAINIMQPKAVDMKRVDFIEDKVRREFAAMTVSLDDGIGRLINALDRNGQSEDTLVIFITDHGGDPVYGGSNLPLRKGKATLFDGGIRVPCLMRWPGKIKPGTVSDSVCSSLDIFPTLISLTGSKAGKNPMDGQDLSPVLFEGEEWRERTLYWELGAHAELNRKPWKAIRRGDWKYVQTNEGEEFLFNIRQDPNEKKDLREKYSKKFEELKLFVDSESRRLRG